MQDYFLDPLARLFEFWGLNTVQVLEPGDGASPSITLAVWLADRVREAEQINWAAIGWVGVVVTLYAAISLMVTIENCFNLIYRAPQGRSWTFRFPMYWFALTISPVLIVFSTCVDRSIHRWLALLQARPWLSSTAGVMWSLVAIWIVLCFIYLLVPNTQVRLRPALIGAGVAAVLLEIGKRTLGVYLSQALSLSQLYGSLGLIPLFMFWVYLMWLAVLSGLQVSSTPQHLHGRRLDELEQQRSESLFLEPAAVIGLMQQIAARFSRGQAAEAVDLARQTGLSEAAVERILDRLVAARLIHRLANDSRCVALARPPQDIRLSSLLEIGFAAAPPADGNGGPRSEVYDRLHAAQLRAADEMNLAQLSDLTPPERLTPG